MKKGLLCFAMLLVTFCLTGCINLKKSNDVSGSYKCTSYSNPDGDVILKLDLNGDDSFTYKTDNGEVKGNYSFEKEDKTFEDYKYYMITLNPEKATYNGEKMDLKNSIDIEFALTKKNKKKEGVVIFVSSYNMYYCKNY